MKIQVNASHYQFSKYVGIERWSSYYYQIQEILNSNGKDILIIGVGDGIVPMILKNLGEGVKVTTVDFDESLRPDILGSVTEIDTLVKEKFDIVVCCQVLEHIPFTRFEETIQKLASITKEKLILSLPNHAMWVKILLKIPVFPEIKQKFPIKIFWEKKWDINDQGGGEHYWEIGGRQYGKKRVQNIIKKYNEIVDCYVPMEHTYHMFFILKPYN